MNEKQIRNIVALVTVAVVILISVQIYWIITVYNIESEKFDRTVSDVLSEIPDKLEKDETTNVVMKTINTNKVKNVVFIADDDSATVIADSSPNGQVRTNLNIKSDGKDNRWQFNFEFSDSSILIDKQNDVNFYSKDVDTVTINNQKNIRTVIRRKSDLVEEVIEEIITAETQFDLRTRIDKVNLDSLISEGLSNKGIFTSYEYAVREADKDTFTIVSDNAVLKNLWKTKFRISLFPESFFNKSDLLLVNFPHKGSYVISSISSLLILSIILISVIATAFYYTIRMLIRQKKITQVKNDLINNMTHEFKTPISTISLACEALTEPKMRIEENSVLRYSNMIKDENNRLQKMVEGILSAASMENEEIILEKEIFDVNQIIQELQSDFQLLINEKNVEFEVSQKSTLLINADYKQFKKVFSNLIDNAIKYSNNNPKVKIISRDNNPDVIVEVKDNGIGIPSGEQDKIFNSFYRIPKGNIHDVKGYGIGLYFVKKILEAHNAKIKVSSVPGNGTTFTINIPGVADE